MRLFTKEWRETDKLKTVNLSGTKRSLGWDFVSFKDQPGLTGHSNHIAGAQGDIQSESLTQHRVIVTEKTYFSPWGITKKPEWPLSHRQKCFLICRGAPRGETRSSGLFKDVRIIITMFLLNHCIFSLLQVSPSVPFPPTWKKCSSRINVHQFIKSGGQPPQDERTASVATRPNP